MQYRKLGNTDAKVSVLGFGAMRLPTINDEKNNINKNEATKLLDYAIKNGINYIDTAYPYHGNDFTKEGESERFLGKYFSNSFKNNKFQREDIYIATKMPSWLIKTENDMEKIFNRQLELLQTDYLDFYLIHSVKKDIWNPLKDLNVLKFLDKLKDENKARYIGFSFHDSFDFFIEVLDDYNWDITQTQMNYLDVDFQSGLDGLRYADALGLGNIIMEPLRGGKLANNIPSDIQAIWNSYDEKRTPAQWAFKYLYNMREVDLVLSGMNTMEQLKENIAIANNSLANTMSAQEKELIKEVAKEYKSKKGNDCNGCGYCMPCPQGVMIPDCFKEYNQSYIFNEHEQTKHHYNLVLNNNQKASNCINCGLCVKLCTQQINIPEELKKVKKLFED
ncbi:MAG: aldo/keto reductase [Methanobrevibacter sp.]|jgi:predicted aldo/keto reductase-like oxidoreductase|nr:aldo/keto reductase [Candidatus Methanoflexus mossambicus]